MRIISIIVALLMGLSVSANDNLSLNVSGQNLSIGMKNDAAYCAFQLDVTLPSGIDVIAVNKALRLESTDESTSDFIVDSNMISENTLRIIGYNSDNRAITGNMGDLLNLTMSSSTTEQISATNIRFVEVNTHKETLFADAWNTPTVDEDADTDISEYANVMYIINKDVFSGSTAVIPVYLKNETSFSAFSFDLQLPTGITVAKDAKNKPIVVLDGERKDDQTVSANLSEDGKLSVASLSLTNSPFSGNEGVIVNVTVDVAEDLVDGEYPIILTNVRMATPTMEEYKVEKVKSTVTVVSYIPGDVNNDGEISIVDAVGIVNFVIKSNTAGLNEKAADANQDGEISIVDAVCVVNEVIHADISISKSKAMHRAMNSMVVTKDVNLTDEEYFDVPIIITGNANETAALQCTIRMPEGLELVGATADYDHTVAYNRQDNGDYLLACLSLDNSTFAGNGTEAMSLRVRRNAGFNAGQISISGIELASNNMQSVRLGAVNVNVSVDQATHMTGINSVSESGNVYDIQGRKTNGLGNNVYIVNGKKIIKK